MLPLNTANFSTRNGADKPVTHTKAHLAAIAISILGASAVQALTLVEGDISGTWTQSESPYIVTADATVPTGQTLTINPGITVQIAPDTQFIANGAIIAKGTPTNRITFDSVNPTVRWDTLLVNYASGPGSEFTYCDFSGATNALTLQISNKNVSKTMKVYNCTFDDCTDFALIGFAHGRMYQNMGGFSYFRPSLKIDVRNSIFRNSGGGVKLSSAGTHSAHPYYGFIGNLVSIHGNFQNNLFENISGQAHYFEAEAHTTTATALVANSVLSQVGTGVEYQSKFNTDVKNCIFADSTNGLVRTTTDGIASYNCFWNCDVPFTGYSSNHGLQLLLNQNGTLSDIAFNIFEDPLFDHSTSPFSLSSTSPCIDAGDPSEPTLADIILPDGPSQGSRTADQGIFGGADACNWMGEMPFVTPFVEINASEGEVHLTWNAIPRGKYIVEATDTLTDSFEPADGGLLTPSGNVATFSRTASPTGRGFLRVTHLGRTPGD